MLASAASVKRGSGKAFDRTEDNPLFLEELARSVGEHGTDAVADAVPVTVQEVTTQSPEVLTAIQYRYGIGRAERALGRIALARGDPTEARRWLDRALATFASIDARHEVARTHLHLAGLATAEARAEQAALHFRAARTESEANAKKIRWLRRDGAEGGIRRAFRSSRVARSFGAFCHAGARLRLTGG